MGLGRDKPLWTPLDPLRALIWLPLTALFCVGVWVGPVRPVEPRLLPALELDARAVAARLAEDRALAAKLPKVPIVDRLRELFLTNGELTIAGAAPRYRVAQLYRQNEMLLRQLVDEHGKSALEALRADDLLRFDAVRKGELSGDEARQRLGDFPIYLERHGLVQERVQLAPEHAVRALYAARWNQLHARPLTEGFREVDLLAYEGWVALHSPAAPLERKLEAVRQYAAHGGFHGQEALGVLLYRAGAFAEAARVLEAEYAHSGALRLRNYAAAARARSL